MDIFNINLENEVWRPDKKSVIPLFKQIYDFIISKISSGEWSIGSKLPTQQEMAKRFCVNRSTISEVYEELKTQCFIETKTKSGSIIINNTWSLLTSNAPLDWTKKISSSIYKPNLDIIKIINDVETDKNIIRLGAGELGRDLIPDKYLEEIFKAISKDIEYMGYDEPKGLYILREEIAKYLKKKGIDTNPSKILIVSGAIQALNLISIGLLKRNSVILTEKASYLKSLTIFNSHNINLYGVEMDNGGIVLDELVKKTITKRPELLYLIPNYQNPTGIIMSKERRKKLLEVCENERLAIIEDDVYSEIWFDEEPPYSIKSEDKNGTVLYIGSISKTLSAGMRIGWIVGNENVINRLADIKMQTDYGSSNISQWMCYEFLKSGLYESFTKNLRRELKLKRDFTIKLLEKYFKNIAKWNVPKGGFYIWLKFNFEVSQYKLFEECYKNKIIINPGILYDELDKRSIRISFAYASKKDLEIGLSKLAKIMAKYQKNKI